MKMNFGSPNIQFGIEILHTKYEIGRVEVRDL